MVAVKSQSGLLEKIIEIENPPIFKWEEVFSTIKKFLPKNSYLIKLNLIKTSKTKLFFHVVLTHNFSGFLGNPFEAVLNKKISSDKASCLIVPTGIGASIGGYAGDANVLAKIFSHLSEYLIVNPNVVNGAVLSDLPSNAIYLEGFYMDQFLLGNVNLIPNNKNKIGVVFDKTISEERLEYEVNVLNALKVFYGCDICGWTVTEKPLNIIPSVNDFGFSSGNIENLEYLLESALKLKDIGATSIAICSLIPDLDLNPEYVLGKGLDPIGGIESIISRLVSAGTGLVSAHAPVLISNEKIDYKIISPLSAAEYIAPTFLPSVISGLRFAPQIRDQKSEIRDQRIGSRNIENIIVPYNAFGSPGVFYSNEIFNNVVLVKENVTCLEVNPVDIKIKFNVVDSYKDLIGEDKLNELGIDIERLKRPVVKIGKI